MKELELVMLKEKVKTPMRSTTGSAGFDVFAASEIVLPKGKIVNLKLPFTFEGKLDGNIQVRLFVRSSFGIKKKVRLVENSEKDIEGIKMDLLEQSHSFSLLNDSDKDIVIEEGEHFAQFIISEKKPKEEEQRIEALTPEELGDIVPTKGHMEEVRPNVFDYVLDEEITLEAGEQVTLPTGYRSVIEQGTWTAIVPHESVRGIVMLGNAVGVVDCDYAYNTGNFGLCFIAIVNLKNEKVVLPIGTKLTRWHSEKYYILENEIKTDNERTGGVGHTS